MKKLTAKQTEQLRRLAAMPDEDIDYSDIPPIRDWTGAVRGRFYRPIKQAVTLRLDADVLDWFKSQGPKYQTRINQLLRTHMLELGGTTPEKPGVHEQHPAYSVPAGRSKADVVRAKMDKLGVTAADLQRAIRVARRGK